MPSEREKLMKKVKPAITIFFLFVGSLLSAQDGVVTGQVSFVTSNNIYVRFENTASIKVGDSLRLDGKTGSPCLLVSSMSSTSCVCVPLFDCGAEKGAKVTFIPPTGQRKVVAEEKIVPSSLRDTVELAEEDPVYLQEIRARISASTYSLVSNDRADRHRLMSRLSIDADHINDSKVSADVYLNFRQIFDEPTSNLQNTSLLRVYNFSVGYDASPTLNLLLGRNINPKISSLGAIDGLQAEKQFGNSYVGLLVGSRPDIFNFGYNPDLLEYGAYYGFNTNSKNINAQTTLGLIEQRGNGDIDRRYAYVQHTSTLSKNLNFFTSAELDLYSKVDYTTKNELRLTSLYSSLRYRFSKAVNLMVSYDTRKRIIYYETYRTDLDQLLDDDLARQGIRGRMNFRPFKNILTGFSYSKRFQSDQQNKSDNIYGYLTLSHTPFMDGRTSFSYNRNESNYLLSNIASVRHSRSFFYDRLYTDLYYRLVQYNYSNITDNLLQHYMGADVSYNINRTLLFSITGEFSMYNDSKNYRVYTRLVQRFHSKHKR
ncbi:hypothetical protein D2U88_08380 [Flagellimonas aequoris]|nr:hypothetical protein D2U88_08380 [Allomuricauda aequoris]